MKRILLSLLACGMFASTFAQPEVSDKWIISPVSTMKGVLGRLNMNFPAGVNWHILLYHQADNKFITSFSDNASRNAMSNNIAPGEYRIVLTSVPIENVPIQKGHETRLKAGFLNVVSEGDWFLYNETKEKLYTTGNKPQKMVLPVGSYQVKLGGQFYPVIIKDGETVEDYTPVEVKNETPGNEKVKTIETDPITSRVNESAKWVITPVSTMKGVLGRLDINFPADVERDILIYQPADNKFITSVSRNDKIYTIAPGQYRFTLSSVPVDNVPIQKGHETRLKMGFLNVVSEGDWHLFNDTKEKQYTSGNKPKKIPLPVGSYQVKLGGQFYPVIIKDGETVEDYTPVEVKDGIISQETPEIIPATIKKTIETDKWVISPINSPLIELDEQDESSMDCEIPSLVHGAELTQAGSLYLDYPAFWSIRIRQQSLYIACGGNDWGVCGCPKSYPLREGRYDIYFNHVSIIGVPIMAKYETKLKTGKVNVLIDKPWGIYNLSKDTNYMFGINPGEVMFPVGTYSVFNNDRYETIELKQGQTIEVHPNPNKSDFKIDPPWLINPVLAKIKNDSGRVNLVFDLTVTWSLGWTAPGVSNGETNAYNSYIPPPSRNIAPGTYTFTLNKVKVPNVPILANKETKLKVGYLHVTTNKPWEVRDRSVFNTKYASSEGSLNKIVLPVGTYLFKLDLEYFFIRIENGKTLVW